MDIKQSSDSQTASWKYFPDINTLVSYLNRKDFVELSKCSKFYRNQLERRVLEKLKLGCLYDDICEIHEGLEKIREIEKMSELLKSDLGVKLKLVQSIDLYCEVSRVFAESFAKLLPNIKTLRFDGDWACECGCDGEWQQGLITILTCMDNLEHVKIEYESQPSIDIGTKNRIFPKSLKSLKSLNIYLNDTYYKYGERNYKYYDTIDSSYINLQSLTIVSNKMLENLSSGLSSLQKVDIKEFELDKPKFIKFLKANPQLRKMITYLSDYNEEIIQTVLSSKNLEHWSVCSWFWTDKEVDSLPSNYSIKHLGISYDIPALLALKLINACKNLETLDLIHYSYHLNSLEWSKIEQRVNILKLSYDACSPEDIKKIDDLRLFNNIHIERGYKFGDKDIEKFIDQINGFKLINYSLLTLISKDCILKLINKAD